MRVTVDRDKCIMAGECVYNHPWLFEFGDDNVATVKSVEIVTEQHRKEARQAAAVCPGGAISVIDD